MLADILATLGFGAAETSSQGCIFLGLDEPECPESLIK